MNARLIVLPALIVLSLSASAPAIEPVGYLRESGGVPLALGEGCVLEDALTGDCANLSYYNLCAGYVWLFSFIGPGRGWACISRSLASPPATRWSAR